ncbi:unnamed protein product [Lupinus luteus]|uniref:Glutamate--ammonia ligase n=1 Tax=Lupinus luteus TaxID=3873 RepID=A0AAV1YNX5_LUPLU
MSQISHGHNNEPATIPDGDSLHAPPPFLPFELITEILSRVPVKFLIQFKCVCKSWKTLISNPEFAQKHLSTVHHRHHLLLSINDALDNLIVRSYSLPSIFEASPPISNQSDKEAVKSEWQSTKSMREDGGYEAIKKAILNLSLRHKDHICAYGEANERRLTGKHETASINQFSWGVANRGCSIRVGRDTEKNDKGGSSKVFSVMQSKFLSHGHNNEPATIPDGDSLHAPSPFLPFELITEILYRVPVKFLIQFKCVCKSWKTLISNPEFAQKHLSTVHHRHHLILSINDALDNFIVGSYSLPSVFETSPPISNQTDKEAVKSESQSTKSMREDGGYEAIKKAILNLSLCHNDHISAYGEGNERRLSRKHETASINQFSWGVANRGCSIRVGRDTEKNGKDQVFRLIAGATASPIGQFVSSSTTFLHSIDPRVK